MKLTFMAWNVQQPPNWTEHLVSLCSLSIVASTNKAKTLCYGERLLALVVNSVLPDWACRKLPIPALLMAVCNTKHAAQGKTLQTKRAASNRRLRKGQEVSENQEYNNFNGYNHSPESSTKTDYCHLVVWSLIASHKDSERTSESAVVVVGHSRRGHDMSQPPSSRRCLFFAASGPLLIMWRIWKLSQTPLDRVAYPFQPRSSLQWEYSLSVMKWCSCETGPNEFT